MIIQPCHDFIVVETFILSKDVFLVKDFQIGCPISGEKNVHEAFLSSEKTQ